MKMETNFFQIGQIFLPSGISILPSKKKNTHHSGPITVFRTPNIACDLFLFLYA